MWSMTRKKSRMSPRLWLGQKARYLSYPLRQVKIHGRQKEPQLLDMYRPPSGDALELDIRREAWA